MAELTLRLVVDPVTGRREIVVDYRSDADALPEEHEEAHRGFAAAFGGGSREGGVGGGPAPATAALGEEPAGEPEKA